MQLYGKKPLMTSKHPVKFCDHRHCSSGDITVLVCHVILYDHVTLLEGNSQGKSPPCQVQWQVLLFTHWKLGTTKIDCLHSQAGTRLCQLVVCHLLSILIHFKITIDWLCSSSLFCIKLTQDTKSNTLVFLKSVIFDHFSSFFK